MFNLVAKCLHKVEPYHCLGFIREGGDGPPGLKPAKDRLLGKAPLATDLAGRKVSFLGLLPDGVGSYPKPLGQLLCV